MAGWTGTSHPPPVCASLDVRVDKTSMKAQTRHMTQSTSDSRCSSSVLEWVFISFSPLCLDSDSWFSPV